MAKSKRKRQLYDLTKGKIAMDLYKKYGTWSGVQEKMGLGNSHTAKTWAQRYAADVKAGKGSPSPVATKAQEPKRGHVKKTILKWLESTNETFDKTVEAHQSFVSDTGVEVSPNHFAKIAKQHKGRSARTAVKSTEIMQLQDEVAYLRWLTQGERAGYVDRMLKELQEG